MQHELLQFFSHFLMLFLGSLVEEKFILPRKSRSWSLLGKIRRIMYRIFITKGREGIIIRRRNRRYR